MRDLVENSWEKGFLKMPGITLDDKICKLEVNPTMFYTLLLECDLQNLKIVEIHDSGVKLIGTHQDWSALSQL